MDKKKLITIILAVACIFVACYITFTVASRHGKTEVKLLVAPDKAQIEVAGQKITGSQTIYLNPGDYTFKASREGFEDNSVEKTIKNDPVIISFVLTPLTEEANQELNRSTKLAEIDSATTKELSRERELLVAANPVIEKLPIKKMIYTIGYRADNSRENGVIIEVNALQGYRNAALNNLWREGFDPSGMKINFKDYANPFVEQSMSRRNILLSIAAVLIILSLLFVTIIKPQRKITINFDREGVKGKISQVANDSSKKEVSTITNSSPVSLVDGKYVIETFSEDNSLKNKSTEFTVDGSDKTINITTEFSQSYVDQHLTNQREAIEKTLFAKYPQLKTDYQLYKETLLGKNAEWYVSAYQEKVIGKDNGDIYTVIMKKDGDSWSVKTRPQLINTKYNTRDIPDDILSDAFAVTAFQLALQRHNNMLIISFFGLFLNDAR